jgi:hypothetical protein
MAYELIFYAANLPIPLGWKLVAMSFCTHANASVDGFVCIMRMGA